MFKRKNIFVFLLVGDMENCLCRHVAEHMEDYPYFSDMSERETQLMSRMFGFSEEQIRNYLSRARSLMRSGNFSQIGIISTTYPLANPLDDIFDSYRGFLKTPLDLRRRKNC